MNSYVKIKIIVDGCVYYFTNVSQDGTVFMEKSKQKAPAIPRIECQDLFPVINSYFDKVNKKVYIEAVPLS